MFAPAPLRKRVTANLSARVMPSQGAGSNAEPPPESSTRHNVRASAARTSSKIRSDPATPSAVGSFTPAGRAACSVMPGAPCVGSSRTQSVGTLSQPLSCFSRASRGPSTSSNPAAIPAPALPPPTTRMRSKSSSEISSLPISKTWPSTCTASRINCSERTPFKPACQIARASSWSC